MERVLRVAQIIEGYLVNLGEEGYLVRMQLEELLGGTEKNRLLLLKDYKRENIDLNECSRKIRNLSEEDLLNKVKIAKVLGYSGISEDMDLQVQTKGYRILNKVHQTTSINHRKLSKLFWKLPRDFTSIYRRIR